MALYEISEDGLISIAPTRFDSENLAERRDIQRLLRDQIEALDDNLLVLAEEYGNWHDSLRRIDLLCLDRDAALVVVELKRSNDGGHMELQALRYAAMVSSMTFDQAVDALCTYSAQRDRTETADDARTRILDHLGWDEVDEDRFARVTRIMLASADFSRELTTSVLWLRERGIDIRCVRLAPHRLADGRVLLNIETIIPLAEAADFQTRIGAKKQAERVNDLERHDLRYRFWQGLLERARQRTNLHAGRSPNRQTWVSGSTGRPGYAIIYGLRQEDNHAMPNCGSAMMRPAMPRWKRNGRRSKPNLAHR